MNLSLKDDELEIRDLISIRIANKKNFKRVMEDDSLVLSFVSSRFEYLHYLIFANRHFWFLEENRERKKQIWRVRKRGRKNSRL